MIERGINPVYLWLGLTVLYIALMCVLAFAKIDGVNINAWNLFGMKDIGFGRMAVFSFVFSLSVFVFICFYRLFVRKA
jgi:hypothetical protein